MRSVATRAMSAWRSRGTRTRSTSQAARSSSTRPAYIERLRDERVGMVVSTGVGMVASAGELTPQLRGCVQRVRAYQARMVLSRARGDSVPLEFVLYRFTC